MSRTVKEAIRAGEPSACCDTPSCCGGDQHSSALQQVVREDYAHAAKSPAVSEASVCCDKSTCCGGAHNAA